MTSEASTICRLILDPPRGGAWNMAVDEVLLQTAATENRPTLRFYRWSEPTLSLGYFQKFEDRLAHRPSRQCPVVRRSSGGGAIVHDAELTYSFAMPMAHPLGQDPLRLYRGVHEALLAVLRQEGVVADFVGAAAAEPAEPPLLCFQRRSELDIVIGNAKICGSAQRRWRGAVLQHGSLILATSAAAPELPGLKSLLNVDPAGWSLDDRWGAEIASRLQLRLCAGVLSENEMTEVRTLAIEKYNTHSWNRKR